MSFFGSISKSFGGLFGSAEKATNKDDIDEEYEKKYKEAKKAFDHFLNDEKFVEIRNESEKDNS